MYLDNHKLYDILEKKYNSLLMDDFIRTFKRSSIEGISCPTNYKWEEFLESMDIKTFPRANSVSIKNPAPHSGSLSIPNEVAEKILVLGDLP